EHVRPPQRLAAYHTRCDRCAHTCFSAIWIAAAVIFWLRSMSPEPSIGCWFRTMRIIFMGSPEFAVPTLLEMARSGRTPVAVYTRAPAKSGRRGLQMRRTPVHSAAHSLGIPVFSPSSLRNVETQEVIKGL